jgi:hypothetical protein
MSADCELRQIGGSGSRSECHAGIDPGSPEALAVTAHGKLMAPHGWLPHSKATSDSR